MHRMISLFLLLLFLSACAAPTGESSLQAPDTPPQETPAEDVSGEDTFSETGETEDHVLLTLEAPLADGRTLTLEALGKELDEYTCGVREVRVYDGGQFLQTVLVREATELEWDYGNGILLDSFYDYTECWSSEDSMEALDLNFDGNTDFGLFGWTPNNTIPYYYWLWDVETEQYRYAFTLQGVGAHPEEGEISAKYKSGSAGSQWIVEYYKPDENGGLYLDRIERDTFDFEPEDGYLDYDRGRAQETWVPPEGVEPIRPDDPLTLEADLVLIRREVPVYEVDANNMVSHFTEIWELKDGKFQMTSREEFFYDNQQ